MMTSYTLTSATLANTAQPILRSDGAYIPPDPDNVDFQSYLAWLAAGQTPTPCAALAMSFPTQVSRRQFFQAAAKQGLIAPADVLALFATGTMPARLADAIATLPDAQRFEAQLAILGDPIFARENAIVIALWATMGASSAELDTLFALAATL